MYFCNLIIKMVFRIVSDYRYAHNVTNNAVLLRQKTTYDTEHFYKLIQ